jgi:hypothetical protein
VNWKHFLVEPHKGVWQMTLNDTLITRPILLEIGASGNVVLLCRVAKKISMRLHRHISALSVDTALFFHKHFFASRWESEAWARELVKANNIEAIIRNTTTDQDFIRLCIDQAIGCWNRIQMLTQLKDYDNVFVWSCIRKIFTWCCGKRPALMRWIAKFYAENLRLLILEYYYYGQQHILSHVLHVYPKTELETLKLLYQYGAIVNAQVLLQRQDFNAWYEKEKKC